MKPGRYVREVGPIAHGGPDADDSVRMWGMFVGRGRRPINGPFPSLETMFLSCAENKVSKNLSWLQLPRD